MGCHEETYVLTGVSSPCVINSPREGEGSQDRGGRAGNTVRRVGCGRGRIVAGLDVGCEEAKNQE